MRSFILISLFPIITFGNCLDNLLLETPNAPELIMECNNIFLKGQFWLLNSENKLKQPELGRLVLQYAKCEEISRQLTQYIEKCKKLEIK